VGAHEINMKLRAKTASNIQLKHMSTDFGPLILPQLRKNDGKATKEILRPNANNTTSTVTRAYSLDGEFSAVPD